MKKAVKWVIILAVLGGGGYYGFQKSRAGGTEAAAAAFDAVPVETRDIRITVETTGEVQPRNRLDVKSAIAGRLEELLVDEGDTVKKGQILGWVSSTERATLLDAALATSKEEYDYWSKLYKASPLISPLDGTIIARNFEPGQSIATSDSVVVIADDLIIVANLDETDIGQIENGQSVEVSLEAYPDREFSCVVEKIAYDATTVSSVTTYEVDVRPRHLPRFARSGMTANLNFVVEEKTGVLALPASAVQQESSSSGASGSRPDLSGMSDADRKAFMMERMRERGLSDAEIQERLARGPMNGGRSGPQENAQPSGGSNLKYFVLVASNDPAKPERRDIQVGVSDGSYTEVTTGLAAGDEVLVQRVSFGSKKSNGNSLFTPQMGRGPR